MNSLLWRPVRDCRRYRVNLLGRITKPIIQGIILATLSLLAGVWAGVLGSDLAGASTSDHPISWLAAGDSYAAGQGLTRTVEPCAQGTGTGELGSTWAIVAAKVLRSDKFDIKSGSPDLVACTGAVSDDFFNRQAKDKPPQWTKPMGRYDLVTFSFGGDDIDFADVVEACTVTHCPADEVIRKRIAALGTTGETIKGRKIPSYPTFLAHVATAAVVTGGNIVVMGYPELVEDPSLWGPKENTCAGFTIADADTARGWAGDLNATIGNSVNEVNALPSSKRNGVHLTFIDPVTGQFDTGIALSDPNLFEPSSGTRHELCSQNHDAWLNGVSLLHPKTRSFHPNQQGETAMGNLASEVIPKLRWPWNPAPSALSAQPSRPNTAPSTGTWSTGTLVNGTGGYLDSVSCPSAAFCVAGAAGGYEYTFSRGTWSSGQRVVHGGTVNSLSCSSPAFCVAVDDNGSAYTYSHGEWSSGQHIENQYGNPLNAVSCASGAFCVAVDDGVYTYANGSWSSGRQIETVPAAPVPYPPGLQSVSCPTSSFCVAVDSTTGNAFTYANGTWSSAQQVDPTSTVGPEGFSPGLYSVSCPATTFCMAVDSNTGDAFKYENGTWSSGQQVAAASGGGGLGAVSCPATTFCVAVSNDGYVYTYSQGSWSDGQRIDNTSGDSGLDSVSCPTSTFCVATSDRGYAYTYSAG